MNPVQFDWNTTLRETALRRQIPAEIHAIRNVVRASELNDTTTQLIDRWQRTFLHDFRLSADTPAVLQRNIELLHEILRDPISGAPLGPEPLLGTDGHTYGSGISVYLLAAPAHLRHLSPLEPDMAAPFQLRPHPVAGYLVGWLERRGASRYSQNEERARRALLLDHQRAAQEAERPEAERMAQLIQERTARNAQVNASRRARGAAFDALFARQMAQNRQAIQQMVAPLRQAEQRSREQIAEVEAIGQRDQAGARGLMERLQERAETQQKELEEIAQESGRSHEEFGQQLASVQGAIEAVTHGDVAARQIIQTEIRGIIREGFNPIAEQIAFDKQNGLGQLQRIDAAFQARMAPFRASIDQLHQRTVQLEAEKERLMQTQVQTEQGLSLLEQKTVALQKEIIETKIAIQKVREKEKPKWYATALKIGACALINWAMPVNGVFFPDGQGFVFRTVINLG